MNKTRFYLGLLVSVTWLLCVILFMIWKRADFIQMSPNAWGDFFAGVFSPLAFMWLVLGYLQQGEELRLSTDALHLQAKELSESAKQQQALVAVGREELEAVRSAAERDHRARQAMTQSQISTEFGTLALGRAMETISAWVVQVRAKATGGHPTRLFDAYVSYLSDLDQREINTKDDQLEAARRAVKSWFLKCLASRETDQLPPLGFEQLVSRDRAAIMLYVIVMTRAQTEWW